jgi:hypothetical protein
MDFKKSFHHEDKVAPDPSGEVFDKLAKYLLLMHNWNKQPVTRTRTATARARARASKNYKDLTENVRSAENIRLWNQIQLQLNTIAIRYFQI